jgi:hypothetical protein
MRRLRPPLYLAEKMGKGLGGSEVLQPPVPEQTFQAERGKVKDPG